MPVKLCLLRSKKGRTEGGKRRMKVKKKRFLAVKYSAVFVPFFQKVEQNSKNITTC